VYNVLPSKINVAFNLNVALPVELRAAPSALPAPPAALLSPLAARALRNVNHLSSSLC
jgi:hypothetical protein